MRLQVGDEAPDFELAATGQTAGKGEINLPEGKRPINIRLSDYRGRKNVMLAFYPAAFTPV
jgi:peroxiredoxin